MARVTLIRARSEADAARRSRPPSPTALESSRPRVVVSGLSFRPIEVRSSYAAGEQVGQCGTGRARADNREGAHLISVPRLRART